MNGIELSLNIKSKAYELGFDACGIAKVHALSSIKEELFEQWVNNEYHGEMSYLARNIEMRHNPALLMENAHSVISVLLNYFPEKSFNDKAFYRISKYAYGEDYHEVIKKKLKSLIDWIKTQFPQAQMRSFTDSAPINDRFWAQQAGLGWIGKNTLLINKNLGSFFFIGEILIDVELPFDNPFETQHCGTCQKCIESCPTNALQEPYLMDACRCISYLNIESKSDVPNDLQSKLNGWIYGCDICQDVCPWNGKSKANSVPEFKLSDTLFKMEKSDYESLNHEIFDKLFTKSPIKRSGFERLKYMIELNKPKD